MQKTRIALFTASLVGVTMLGGCGSSGSGGSDVVVPSPENIQTVGISNCGICHSADTTVANNWLQSIHATGHDGGTDPACLVCHDPLGDGKLMEQVYGGDIDGAIPPVTNGNVVACESCHGGGSAHRGLGLLPYPLPGPAQCGQCHGITGPLTSRHAGNADQIIYDTHHDNPNTPDIEGYVVNTADQHGCEVCHFNGHRLDLTINREWWSTGHAGYIKQVKAAGGIDAAITDEVAPAWVHYDFKDPSRAACQRCHTATGSANFLNGPSSYDPANNAFFATGQQKEMLYCWGCHADNTGALRNPGALTIQQTGTSVSFPNALSSNVCIACHSGRESGGTIEALATAGADWSNQGFVNSHYMAAAGILYTVSGYQYNGRDYDPDSSPHRLLGKDTVGPCVKCHMSDTAGADAHPDHTLAVITRDDNGAISGLHLDPTPCIVCHDGIGSSIALTPANLNAQEAGFNAALEALQAQLAENGFSYQTAYPYFTATNWGDASTGPNNMGAAFNFNLLKREPGAFVHNAFYARQLIWDSIDWLDNGILDNSTDSAITGLDDAAIDPATKDAAKAWLDNIRL